MAAPEHLKDFLNSQLGSKLVADEVSEYPNFTLASELLDCNNASWSRMDDKPISLGVYIFSVIPQLAQKLGIQTAYIGEPVRKIPELEEDELKKLYLSMIKPSDVTEYSCEFGPYTPSEMINFVTNNTVIGKNMLFLGICNLWSFIKAIEAGKLQGLHKAVDESDWIRELP